MEFEFKKDFISGAAAVKLSMGHEAFATWLEQEGQQIVWIEGLLAKTALLQQRSIMDFILPGSEFSLLLNQDEAQVVNHSLSHQQEDSGLDADMGFYDAEIRSACGLEDFVNLIESWLDFIKG